MVWVSTWRNELKDIIARLKLGEAINHFETTRIRKGGLTIHVSLSISPIMDASGRIVGASTIDAIPPLAIRYAPLRRTHSFLVGMNVG
jgi:hypothetical protein